MIIVPLNPIFRWLGVLLRCLILTLIMACGAVARTGVWKSPPQESPKLSGGAQRMPA